jgi:hypothetical protein
MERGNIEERHVARVVQFGTQLPLACLCLLVYYGRRIQTQKADKEKFHIRIT